MSSPDYIVDEPLPLSQDFRLLRKEGLASIQQYSGDNWTNFNASDPGITILDQVCFALTELGYCNDFPIEDILTGINGKINFNDQFYLPEDILTASPVTPGDYIKYIVDGVSGVQNAIIVPVNVNSPSTIDEYQVYLLIDRMITDKTAVDILCFETFIYLNSARNLGEKFSMPQCLPAVTHFITGTIELADPTQLNTVLNAIDQNLRGYIFPAAVQSGYEQLIQAGFDINQVFNGPLLKHGWIPSDHLGEKTYQLRILDLFRLIGAVPGVESASGFTFDGGPLNMVICQPNELLVIDLKQSVQQGLKFYYKGSEIKALPAPDQGAALAKSQTTDSNIQLGAAKKIQTTVPNGKYRDINSYYSIQNTFPEAFAVGANAAGPGASALQAAQSRQLKGYLTLFDQVLANQFSQLANIDRLFSFRNSLTGTPSDELEYHAVKDKYGREHPEYPAPYLYFAPTYFYQSLYDVPNIRPLLKDFDTLKFSPAPESEKELTQKSWLRYKEDPYNPYIWGLMEFMEENSGNIQRREAILDHLLARHGESAVMINTIIDGSMYTGDSRKDRIVFKSLYLQNLGLLSYYRQKAHNYLAATKIAAKVEEFPVRSEKDKSGDYTTDFIFDSGSIDCVEKLKEEDFEEYSALELKLNLLFGLDAQYRSFIANGQSTGVTRWMITQRKGFIFIESALLLPYLGFEVIITSNTQTGPYLQVSGDLSYVQASALIQTLTNNTQSTLADQLQNKAINIYNITRQLVQADLIAGTNQFYKSIAGTGYYFTIRLKEGGEIRDIQNSPLLYSRAVIIFPSFIQQFNTPAFKSRLGFFMENTLPVQLGFDMLFTDSEMLEKLIQAYSDWHNGMIFKNEDNPLPTDAQLTVAANPLASTINEISNAQP